MSKSLKEKIEVMQAALDGKIVEFRPADTTFDWNSNGEPMFNWGDYDYRIKPEPMEFWVNVYRDKSISYGYDSKKECIERATDSSFDTIKVREVVDNAPE